MPWIKHIICILIAAFIYAVGISLFLDPNQLAPGGITGIAVILNRLIGVETGTIYFILNIPIIIIGVWKFGIPFITKTIVAIVAVSFFTNLLMPFGPVTTDLILAGTVGGVLIAVGVGIVFRAGATTGGIDVIIKIIRQRHKYLKTGFLFLCMDVAVVAVSGFVFGDVNLALYALIAVIITGRTLNYVLYGGDEARIIYIMSEKPQKIGARMLEELDVGVTYLQGKGGWTGEEKTVVFSVLPKRLGPKIEEVVKREDPDAFMIISSANEIYGEGYKNIFEEKM